MSSPYGRTVIWPGEPEARPITPVWAQTVLSLPVRIIVAKRSAFDERDPIYALQAAAQFASGLISVGRIPPEMIAAPAKWFTKLTRYVGQVNNGGHGQYVENSQLAEEDVEHCLSALTHIEAWDHLARYKRMLALCSRPDQAGNFVDGAFRATPEMETLNDGWYRLPYSERVAGRVKTYLEREPGLRLVDDDQYYGTMLWIIDRIRVLASNRRS